MKASRQSKVKAEASGCQPPGEVLCESEWPRPMEARIRFCWSQEWFDSWFIVCHLLKSGWCWKFLPIFSVYLSVIGDSFSLPGSVGIWFYFHLTFWSSLLKNMYQFHNQKRNESSCKNKEKPIYLKHKGGVPTCLAMPRWAPKKGRFQCGKRHVLKHQSMDALGVSWSILPLSAALGGMLAASMGKESTWTSLPLPIHCKIVIS